MSTMMQTLPAMPAQPALMAQHDLVVRGSLDAVTLLQLRELVAKAIHDGPVLVLIEVTDVTSITPSGLAGLIDLLRLSRAHGGDLRLWGLSAAMRDAQLQADLTHVFRVHMGRQEAIEAGRGWPPARVPTRRMRWAFLSPVATEIDTNTTTGALR